jgi:hypothetical protein
MILTAMPRGQHDKFRNKIERQILELEARIVPGMKGTTVQVLRDQVLALTDKLKPLDDKRNPAHFRPRRQRAERAPVFLFNQTDWIAARWGAKQRCAGVCEICRGMPAERARIRVWEPNTPLTREHVEWVCVVCLDQHPVPEFVTVDLNGCT